MDFLIFDLDNIYISNFKNFKNIKENESEDLIFK